MEKKEKLRLILLLLLFAFGFGLYFRRRLVFRNVMNVNGNLTVSYDLDTLAARIYDALHSYFWENEEEVIRVLKSLPLNSQILRELVRVYNLRYNKDLKEDILRYFSSSQLVQIQEYLALM